MSILLGFHFFTADLCLHFQAAEILNALGKVFLYVSSVLLPPDTDTLAILVLYFYHHVQF